MEEATRIQIVGALWQYVKSNRLQDADNRELINCNSDLAEIFGCGVGEEKLEFHQAVFRLKDHLYDLPPIELALEVDFGDKLPNFIVYELPVFEYGGGNHKE
jgi:chromatin remodeling complex protein RSC6